MATPRYRNRQASVKSWSASTFQKVQDRSADQHRPHGQHPVRACVRCGLTRVVRPRRLGDRAFICTDCRYSDKDYVKMVEQNVSYRQIELESSQRREEVA